MAKIGDIYWLRVEFTDKSDFKIRPIVIVYDKKDDIVYLPLTTNLKKGLTIDLDDIENGFIEKSSIDISKQCIVHKKFLLQKQATLNKKGLEKVLKAISFHQTKTFYESIHKPLQNQQFIEGKSRVNYAGRVFDENEMINLIDSSLDFWLTYGQYSKAFEKKLAEYLGVRWALLVNSGSSANLLAFMALTSPLLGNRRIERGDEVITVAAGFPTTVAPIVQYGAVPVFVDIELKTANIDTAALEGALSNKTKAVMIAHTLGNPFDIDKVKRFCDRHDLWLIEDNCDALGSEYDSKKTGTFGDIGTSSFYPPHHITMGEGGAVYTDNPLLKKIMLSMRDWGRDCWCESGVDNTCGVRFDRKYGTLPKGYDHKYVYSHFGYNLKATDMQAAIGLAQLEKIDRFTAKRRQHFNTLYRTLQALQRYFILPTAHALAEPSWFGFLIVLKEDTPFSRNEIVEYLESRKIQTRNLFAGNITRQPLFEALREGVDYRIAAPLQRTDRVMNDAFWLGVYPGMQMQALDYMAECIVAYCDRFDSDKHPE